MRYGGLFTLSLSLYIYIYDQILLFIINRSQKILMSICSTVKCMHHTDLKTNKQKTDLYYRSYVCSVVTTVQKFLIFFYFVAGRLP